MIGHLIRKAVNITLLVWVDKICGGIVGLLKGVLICGVFLILISAFWPNAISKNSRVSVYVMNFTKSLGFLMPQKIKKEFNKEREDITKYFSGDFWYKLFNIKKGKREL